ncbi:Alpha beta hydrolase [Seminavis robusta]|uniref:Alpha beta hydrolase n=1 Tax=Seminavis robusta TaxID=568900 RepID=A0A9N8H4A5_9STRA|nr:Alpha beta hydrolase [Seminavis robusta]|eukprot:Sro6_g004990.1 Alpha beta hydrolase (438) ;mRNA; f:69046-70359
MPALQSFSFISRLTIQTSIPKRTRILNMKVNAQHLPWAFLASCLVHPIEAALTTEYLAANNLNFTCSVLDHRSLANPDAPLKQLMLLHGFPMFRVWWMPLLQHWDEMLKTDDAMSVHAVACDLRGYSPQASPETIEDYDYSIFAEDTFALAEAAGFTNGFHLLGHDHGAALAWYVAAHDINNQVLSLTTMSVPHIDLLSEALCGDNNDEDQVIASNYFNQFSLPNSAAANNASLTEMFASFGLPVQPESFQKMLWWYNGSFPTYFSLPRVVSDDEVETYKAEKGPEATFFLERTRSAIAMEERPCVPVEDKIGAIEIPTLFICGLEDTSLLCNRPYATDFPVDFLPDYEHANFQCGHDFFLEGNCVTMEESQAVMDKITSFVLLRDLPSPAGDKESSVPTSSEDQTEDSTVDDSSGTDKASTMILTATMALGALAVF